MTHWTPLGYHPEVYRDRTPSWIRSTLLVLMLSFLILYIVLGMRGVSERLLISTVPILILGAENLVSSIYNWTNKTYRYNGLAIFAVALAISYFFFILKP